MSHSLQSNPVWWSVSSLSGLQTAPQLSISPDTKQAHRHYVGRNDCKTMGHTSVYGGHKKLFYAYNQLGRRGGGVNTN